MYQNLSHKADSLLVLDAPSKLHTKVFLTARGGGFCPPAPLPFFTCCCTTSWRLPSSPWRDEMDWLAVKAFVSKNKFAKKWHPLNLNFRIFRIQGSIEVEWSMINDRYLCFLFFPQDLTWYPNRSKRKFDTLKPQRIHNEAGIVVISFIVISYLGLVIWSYLPPKSLPNRGMIHRGLLSLHHSVAQLELGSMMFYERFWRWSREGSQSQEIENLAAGKQQTWLFCILCAEWQLPQKVRSFGVAANIQTRTW